MEIPPLQRDWPTWDTFPLQTQANNLDERKEKLLKDNQP